MKNAEMIRKNILRGYTRDAVRVFGAYGVWARVWVNVPMKHHQQKDP